jgi:hypothetical protein
MEPNPSQVIDGGDTITVARTDGTKGAVQVKLLSIRELQSYVALAAAGELAASAELLAGKPKGWADLVDVADVIRIVESGEALNSRPLPSGRPGPLTAWAESESRRVKFWNGLRGK